MLKRLAARLPVTLTTLLFGILVTAALTRVTPHTNAPAQRCDTQPPQGPPPAAPPKGVDSETKPAADKTPRIRQEEIVNFPGVGRARVSALETFYEPTHLEFRDAETGKLLYSEYVGDDRPGPEDEDRPYLRFRVLHIKGLPDPLVVGLGVTYGVSDDEWELAAVGAVNGELRELTSERLRARDEGGFHFGDLGPGRGSGVASWDFVWADEAHFDPHQFELKVYKWNPKSGRFEWYQVLRTHGKFDDGSKAVRSLSFRLTDVRRSFPDFADFWSE